ncbi:MAG: hypothetical protein PVSMB11_09970 [Desulfuromonadaceae bacterium]
MSFDTNRDMFHKVFQMVGEHGARAMENLEWLQTQMDSYFFITMQNEPEAVLKIVLGLQSLSLNQKLTLADRSKTLILARLNRPGSLYESLRTLQEREISYAEFTHSHCFVPGFSNEFGVQRFDFDRKSHQEIAHATEVTIPSLIKEGIVVKNSNSIKSTRQK